MPTLNETMGQYSELFMLLAAGTYTVAFIAFAWDLAKSSKLLRTVDLQAAAAAAPARIPVAAGQGTRAVDGPPDRSGKDVSGPAGRAERPSSATDGASQGSGSAAGLTADPGMHYGAKPRVPARVAVALTILGAAIHAAGVITRASAAMASAWWSPLPNTVSRTNARFR